MCTAATYLTNRFYFGRTLDHDHSFGDQVTVTPRNFPLVFRFQNTLEHHHALIGMAHVAGDYPLYYEAVNEKGLAMAGLNFTGNAAYKDADKKKDNIAQFEFIPWILGQCVSVKEALGLLERICLVSTPFSPDLPPSQLHWLLADRTETVTVEAVQSGIRVYPNPAGILTNNPPFPEQMFHLNNYMHLSAKNPKNCFSDRLPLETYCHGMGALGLPGDFSSQSRFVRAAFVKFNSRSGKSEEENVSQFFHILGSVEQPRGCSDLGDGKFETTLYTCCCNADSGIYYYTTYENRQITAVDMHREDLDGVKIVSYPLIFGEQIRRQN